MTLLESFCLLLGCSIYIHRPLIQGGTPNIGSLYRVSLEAFTVKYIESGSIVILRDISLPDDEFYLCIHYYHFSLCLTGRII